jgi:uncharacterized protein YecT (DUF1311 family)
MVAGVVALCCAGNAIASDCHQTAKTQREIEDCAKMQMENTSAELQRLYAKYLGTLVGEDRDRLMKAQQAWEQYRDLDCQAAYGTYAGGTMAGAEFAACKAHLTTERVAELKRIYAEPPLPPGPSSK